MNNDTLRYFPGGKICKTSSCAHFYAYVHQLTPSLQTFGLHIPHSEFRLCLQYWLGLQMFEEGFPCPICTSSMDPYGDHAVGCGGNSDRIFQHNVIRDALFSAAQYAALVPGKRYMYLYSFQVHPAGLRCVFATLETGSACCSQCDCHLSTATTNDHWSCNHTGICLGCEGKQKVHSRSRSLLECGHQVHPNRC